MGREIKFRAWVSSKFTNTSWMNTEVEFIGGPINEIFNGGSTRFAEVFYMQFTGLKDKNGVEIYEGDILEYKWKTSHSDLLTVEWSKKDACFLMGAVRTDYAIAYGAVIGNIFENPELLL